MSDPRASNERVSTVDLKYWIESIPAEPEPGPRANLREWLRFIDAREKAWRAAYMWLSNGDGVGRCGDRYADGVKLIQEHLV